MGKQIISATAGGEGIQWADFKGKLLVIEPLEQEKDIKTIHGTADAIRSNVFVLLGPGKSEAFEDTLVFPKVLQSQIRRQIGSIVVGRLTQGEAQRGQNPPWVLAEASAADLKKASEFWANQSIGSADEGDDDFEDDEDGDEPF